MATHNNEYDFIVIGGGTSGLVVAARLTENPELSVLVLEAGDNYLQDPRVGMPAGWSTLLETDADWDFKTAPQEGLNNRSITLPQGRALGGSSAINSVAFTMPSQIGFEAWEKFGNLGWDWNSVEPYFRKFQTLTAPFRGIDDFSHNYRQQQPTSGPIQASFAELEDSRLSKAWNETFANVGYPFKGDVSRGQVLGPVSNPASIDPITRQRSYSASAYLQPILGRKNLKVLTGAQVHKINFSGEFPTVAATGVDFIFQGEAQIATARKEVILAAGALQSPKILELSGIGAASLLKSHGIPVIVENPSVGENLQDHLMCGVSYEVADGVETLDDLARGVPEAVQTAMTQYVTSSSGPFARASVNSLAFLPVVEHAATSKEESIQNLLTKYPAQPNDPVHHEFCRSIIENKEEASGMFLMLPAQGNWGTNTAKGLVAALLPDKYITLAVVLTNPLSAGSVHITSNHPDEKPIVDMKYLSHELDAEILARHVKFLDILAETEPLAGLLKASGRRSTLYENTWGKGTLEEVKAYVRKTAVSEWHPVSTCAMLPKEKGGVVDENLRVYGTKNLRVVDASIMPCIPRANTQTAVYAIAENAADLIKGDW